MTKGAHSEHDAASLLREVVHAVAYLHGHSIIHFDIKPENILVNTIAVSSQNRLFKFDSIRFNPSIRLLHLDFKPRNLKKGRSRRHAIFVVAVCGGVACTCLVSSSSCALLVYL